eukprot:2246298-Prymnesium_polylepis.2
MPDAPTAVCPPDPTMPRENATRRKLDGHSPNQRTIQQMTLSSRQHLVLSQIAEARRSAWWYF